MPRWPTGCVARANKDGYQKILDNLPGALATDPEKVRAQPPRFACEPASGHVSD